MQLLSLWDLNVAIESLMIFSRESFTHAHLMTVFADILSSSSTMFIVVSFIIATLVYCNL